MSASEKTVTTSIAARCLCGVNDYTFTVPTSSLPLESNLCHCDISRRISGVLCTSYVDVPSGNDPPDPSALTPYESSSILTRYFCGTCGTQMFLRYKDDGHFSVATGILDNPEASVKFRSNMWIEDTRDGGASDFIRDIAGVRLDRWAREPQDSAQLPHGWRDRHPQGGQESPAPQSPRLHARCHCAGVQFWISRPSEQSKKAESPYPDLLIPYHSATPSHNSQNQAWWLPSKNRFLAGSCACHTCRRANGFGITWWCFIPTIDITLDEAGKVPMTRYFGTIRTFRSSPDVTRAFCGTCGATVFWDGDWRPTIIDVAVGLLDAESGARAEEWLDWCTTRVSFTEDAHHRSLITALEEGLDAYANRRETT